MNAQPAAIRTIACWLAGSPAAASDCTGEGTEYVQPKRLERDFDEDGEFVCPACDQLMRDEAEAEYLAFCHELALEPYPAV